MGLVMKSGVIHDRVMRRNKKDHRNENAEMRNGKEKRETAGTVLEIHVYYFLLIPRQRNY